MRALRAAVVLLSLAPLATGAEDIETLVARLGGNDAQQRSNAYLELRNRKDLRVIPLLVKALPGMPEGSHHYGVLVIEVYDDKRAVPALKSLATAASPHLRVCVGASLARRGVRGADLVIVKALTQDGVSPATVVSMMYRLYGVRATRVRAAIRGFVAKDRDSSVIGQALYLLQSLDDSSAAPAARALIEDERAGVRALAAAYLYRRGEEGAAAHLAAALLSGVPYAEFSRVRNFLTTAKRVAAEILEALTDLLDLEDDPNVLRTSIDLLGRFEHRPAIGAIRRLLGHENSAVGKAAFEALAGFPGALSRETLLPLLESKDPERRIQAADALRRMDDHSGQAAALDVLRTGEVSVRRDAARVVAGFRTPAAVDALLAALDDGDASVRSQAWSGLTAALRSLLPYRTLDMNGVGYSPTAPAKSRGIAAERLRAWWAENRAKSW